MNKVKKLLRSFDFVLISWILYAELLTFMMMLCFWAQDEQQDDGLLRYVGLRSEGTQKVWILKCEEYWQLSYGDYAMMNATGAALTQTAYRMYQDSIDKNPYDDYQLKPLSKKACRITHVILFFACFAVSVVFWYSTVDWPLLPAMIIALLIIRMYGHLYQASSRKYLAYFGEDFAKSWYYKLGEIWYAILGAFFMITTWLRFLNFGFFGLV